MVQFMRVSGIIITPMVMVSNIGWMVHFMKAIWVKVKVLVMVV